ncbi:hypothetical protein AB0K16_17530 [Nonomuraea jabiensis]|uniref:hypothetical protein n=1 Tax=Nonomuraea jabiensis TaxID=882448 RepID=UPI003419CB65
MHKSEVDTSNVDTTDLTQEEGGPSARADVLPDRSSTKLSIEVELFKGFRFKMETETADHVTTRLAQALLMVIITAAVPGALMAGLMWAASAPGWLIAIAGIGTAALVVAVCLWWINTRGREEKPTVEIEGPAADPQP